MDSSSKADISNRLLCKEEVETVLSDNEIEKGATSSTSKVFTFEQRISCNFPNGISYEIFSDNVESVTSIRQPPTENNFTGSTSNAELGNNFFCVKPFIAKTLSRAISNTIPTNNFFYDKCNSVIGNTNFIGRQYINYFADDYRNNIGNTSMKQEAINIKSEQIPHQTQESSGNDFLMELRSTTFVSDSQDFVVKSKVSNNVKLSTSVSDPVLIVVNGSKFVCTYCGKEFLKKQQLENHLKIHMGLKNFECNMCQKRFIHKQQLENHVKTHTGEKNFICEICSKRFIHKQQLENHRKIHTGQKDFECATCFRRFTHKQQLQNHMKVHLGIKEFMCHMCEKRFTLKQQLLYHVKMHLGVKDFVCSMCDKAFVTKQQLESHFRLHSGVRPYKCMQCDMDFTRLQQLQYHTNKLHCNPECDVPIFDSKSSDFHFPIEKLTGTLEGDGTSLESQQSLYQTNGLHYNGEDDSSSNIQITTEQLQSSANEDVSSNSLIMPQQMQFHKNESDILIKSQSIVVECDS